MTIKENKYRRLLLQTLKIAFGSSFSIYIAEMLNLRYAAFAGSIALLTIVATKWDTVRLSLYRILSFGISAVLAGILFLAVPKEWAAFGIYIFLIVLICELMEWKAAISVNAVIGTHFLTEMDFSYAFVANEFFLVVIGIAVALVLNLFQGNRSQKGRIVQNMRETEEDLQAILGELAVYLDNGEAQRDVWADLRALEEKLLQFERMAFEYQENTFHSHPQYYIDYFEMRSKQCSVLHSLHSEMRKMRRLPGQAKIISEYIRYLADFILERNIPDAQLEKLEEIFEEMKREALPASREEFEDRALLYHVLMDLEDFVVTKKRFVEALGDRERRIYWDGEED